MVGRRTIDLIVLLMLLAGSLGFNVFQALRRPAEPRGGVQSALKVGQVLPDLKGRGTDGSAVAVPMVGQRRPTLIYVFAGGCGWCDANKANLTALVTGVKDTHRVVLVSRDGAVPGYVRGLAISNGSLVTDPADETLKAYHMIAVPQTIVVRSDGSVEHQWLGAYTGPFRTEVERFLGSPLPGVQMEHLSAPSGCRDDVGGVYSAGAIQQIAGRLQQCRVNGEWTPYPDGASDRRP